MIKFFKYCSKCGKRFKPKTKFQRLCDECTNNCRNANFIKMICHKNNMELNKIKQFL